MEKRKFDVVVVGELNIDLILNRLQGFPEIGTEKLADEMTLTMGSSSAIFACNLACLGAKVTFIGKIGRDIFGAFVLEQLGKKGVDISSVIVDPSVNTGATIVLNYGEDRAMMTHPGGMARLVREDITADRLEQGRHLHMSSYFLQPGIRPGVSDLFETAKRLGMTTSIDPEWDPAEQWDIPFETLLPHVDIFLSSEQELLNMTATADVETAFKRLEPLSRLIAVKCGNRGSILYSDGKTSQVKPYLNTEVVDAIGAGDSFNAGFVYGFLNGKSITDCQKLANLTGAISTTAAGGTTAFTTREAVVKLARERFGVSGLI